jgi:RNA polymerase sigma-70 factor (ECF subfamily)
MGAISSAGGAIISLRRDRPSEEIVTAPGGESAMTSVESVFRDHVSSVYGFIYKQVGNHHDAEDLTSEVFLKASDKLDLERPGGAINNWLFAVSRSVIADHWRRVYKMPLLIDIDSLQIAELSARPFEAAIQRQDQLIDQVLDALSPRYAALLRLRFLRGYTLAETAEELGITVGNAKVLQHRALAAAVKATKEVE